MLRYVVVVAVLTAINSPALAAEWYVVMNKAENKCEVTETKPDGEKLVMMGTATYQSKDEAKKARAAMTECPPRKKDKDKDKTKKDG